MPSGGRLAVWVVTAQLVLIACITGAHLVRERDAAALMAETHTIAQFRAGLLQSEIDKYRALPSVLSRDEDVRRVLEDPSKTGAERLEAKLLQIAGETGVNVLYVLNAKGIGVATAQIPRGAFGAFCPTGCASRFYFSEAMRSGSAQLFSLGRANQRPGLYLSHVIKSDAGDRLGVVVAKVEFGPIQRAWNAQGVPALVTDEKGVVLIASNPSWLGYTVTPMPQARRDQIRSTRQFGAMPLDPLPFSIQDAVRAPMQIRADLGRGGGVETSVVASVPLKVPGWRLYLFKPADRALNRAALIGGSAVLLLCALILTLASVLWRRHQRRQAAFRQQIAMRQELERRVAERTRALSTANLKLTNEMESRRRMEADLHRMQDDLVQANKLAVLGQIAAGVAHEVNQPLAAIRTFAASGDMLLHRGQTADAAKNFSTITHLTERIGLITDELRAFSRRSAREVAPVAVQDAIAGALLLTRHRMLLERVELVQETPSASLFVMAERTRLEQVLVNLLQNALDALSGRPSPKITLSVRTTASKLLLTVADNGPGLSEEARAALFMPFSTTKAHGLGLGLVICREIAVELGGDLSLDNSPTGASFTLSLKLPPTLPKARQRTAARG